MASIIFDHVSRRFVLQHAKTRSFQDLFVQSLSRRNGHPQREEFWALHDVSFEIPEGQMVGLIGPNGAGKSTALKLMARILKPSQGKISVRGRLSALIELTAGFHPELSGRENIYLSGALLGLSRRDIQKHLDAIIAFSELEKFIDMPVKHYSSGMYVRLGFAIATCLESDVLLVDEVLAVGDASFQRKCLERIEEIRARGTTIFWVTHSMSEVERSCDRALLLMNGALAADGRPSEIIGKYEELRRQKGALELGMFNAEYISYQVPTEMAVEGRYEMSVTFRNRSPEVWYAPGHGDPHHLLLSYHWLDRYGHMYQLMGPGTPLPHNLNPGESVSVRCLVIPPDAPGIYRLEIDMLVDGIGWFSRHGCPGPQVPVEVAPTRPLKEAQSELAAMLDTK